MNTIVNLLMSQFVTHDVKRFIVSKPPGFTVTPGQGVELAINRPGLSEQGRPFTPTAALAAAHCNRSRATATGIPATLSRVGWP